MRTRQAARLLDEYQDKHGGTNRALLEILWKTLHDKLSLDDTLECLAAVPEQPSEDKREGTAAARDVLAERRRQVEVEGWTPAHDDEHDRNEMARAAAAYILQDFGVPILARGEIAALGGESLWLWTATRWKPKDLRRNLVRACALVLAQIESIARVAITKGEGKCASAKRPPRGLTNSYSPHFDLYAEVDYNSVTTEMELQFCIHGITIRTCPIRRNTG